MDSNIPPEPSPENNLPPPNPGPPPPVFNRPPVISQPPAPARAPRPAGRGTGWKIFAAILLVLLIVSVLFNFTHLVGSVITGKGMTYHNAGYGPRLDEVTVRESSVSTT